MPKPFKIVERSFTVIWQQDDISGLQTYCHSCRKWTTVEAPKSSTPTLSTRSTGSAHNVNHDSLVQWQCLIHVGDMTSLALLSRPTSHSNNKCDPAVNPKDVQLGEANKTPDYSSQDNGDENDDISSLRVQCPRK